MSINDITGGWTTETGKGGHSVVADPLFTDLEAEDFHPAEGSPAIDSASPENCPEVDLEGRMRPYGGGCDIGAYEVGAPPAPTTQTTTTLPQSKTAATTPTPISETLTMEGRPILEALTQTVERVSTIIETVTKSQTITLTETEKSFTVTTTTLLVSETGSQMLWMLAWLAFGLIIGAAFSILMRRR